MASIRNFLFTSRKQRPNDRMPRSSKRAGKKDSRNSFCLSITFRYRIDSTRFVAHSAKLVYSLKTETKELKGCQKRISGLRLLYISEAASRSTNRLANYTTSQHLFHISEPFSASAGLFLIMLRFCYPRESFLEIICRN
jgi:hypothetical protein